MIIYLQSLLQFKKSENFEDGIVYRDMLQYERSKGIDVNHSYRVVLQ